MNPSNPIPLARLMAMAFRYLIDQLHERLAQHGYRDIPPTFGFVLVAIRDAPATSRDLAKNLGVTKQAASKIIEAMEHDGYIKRLEHPDDGRASLVALTRKGRNFLALVEEIYLDIEADWASITGKERMENMREDIRRVMETRHGGSLPHIRLPPG
jgi:DNA-binding MarR family transcriptional regulator